MKRPSDYMLRALELARRGEGKTSPNPPVGAVVVKDGEVVGEGFHPAPGQPHAEVFALKEAGAAAEGAHLYVTLEPCNHQGRTGPCSEAVIEAGIRRVVIGTLDPNTTVAGGGVERLRAAGIEVEVGLLEAECRRLLAPFVCLLTKGRPFVTLKAALTLDGKSATSSGESQWISSATSRARVHQFRDRVDGIMVGLGTVLRDNPRLTTRLEEGEGQDPVRIVVDSRLRIPNEANILNLDSLAPTLIATTPQADAARREELTALGAEILVCNEIEGEGVDLADLLRQLGQRNLQHLLLEGGATLNQALLAAGLIDRLQLYIAPLLFGGADGAQLFSGRGVSLLNAATRLTDMRAETIAEDILITAEVC